MQKYAIIISLIIGLLSLFVQSRPAPKQAVISTVSDKMPSVAVQQPQSEPAETDTAAAVVTTPAAVVSLPASPMMLDEQMLAVQNTIRAKYHLSDQSLDADLCRAAQDYASYLAITNKQSHYANGQPEQRARAAGFTGSLLTPGKLRPDGWTSYGVGEVLAFDHPTLEDAFEYEIVDASGRVHRCGWMHSPEHKAALLEPTYDRAGFGFAINKQTGKPIYVGMFGNSKVVAPAQSARQQPVSYRQVQSFCTGPNCSQGRFRFRGR
jgi:uncharacterized protein YkwD